MKKNDQYIFTNLLIATSVLYCSLFIVPDVCLVYSLKDTCDSINRKTKYHVGVDLHIAHYKYTCTKVRYFMN